MQISREDVVRCFPMVEEIKDETLRQQVIDTWIEVGQRAPYERLEDCAWYPAIESVSLVSHVRAVTRLTLALAEITHEEHGVEYDRDILIAAALLHDVGKPVEYVRDADGKVRQSKEGKLLKHPFIGGAVAQNRGLPLEVVHAILNHSPNSPIYPQTLELAMVILADLADMDTLLFQHGIPSPRL